MGSYQTAWSWLHKIRQAMVHPGATPLSGEVEIDESYLEAPRSGKRGRGAAGKAIIAGAVEKRGTGCGRVRLGVIEDVGAETLKALPAAGVASAKAGSAFDTSRSPGRATKRSTTPM